MYKPKVYVITPIRGMRGEKATIDYMERNCNIAKLNLIYLRKEFPEVNWVCVAENDKIVQQLLSEGKVSISDVLEMDQKEQKRCNGTLAIKWEPSFGAEKEIRQSKSCGHSFLHIQGKPFLKYEDTFEKQRLKKFVGEVMKVFFKYED